MARAEIALVLERRRAAMGVRDAAALAELHAPAGVVESLMAGRHQGRAAIEDVYRAWFKAFPDVTSTTELVLIDGNHAVEVNTTRGTDTGGFMGLPPTNKPFRLPIVFVYAFEDGLIAHERRIYDFTGLLVQIGVLKARPA